MSTTPRQEECRVCVEGGGFQVAPTDNVPLCQKHWNRFLTTYLEGDGYGSLSINAPCDAHLIGAES